YFVLAEFRQRSYLTRGATFYDKPENTKTTTIDTFIANYMKLHRLGLWAFLLSRLQSTAQLQHDICEGAGPTDWHVTNGKLRISSERFKMGKQSVQWEWTNHNSTITIKDRAFETVLQDPRSTFVFWLYNEQNINDRLRFVFYNGEKEVYHFDFQLDFTGWRTAWVMYHRDMVKLADEGIDRMRIEAPTSIKKGK